MYIAYKNSAPPCVCPPFGGPEPGLLRASKYLILARVNTLSIPFSKLLALRIYNRQAVSVQANRVYLGQTVSTDYRPLGPYTRANDVSGPFFAKGAFGSLPKYCHFASTTCRQCLPW